MNTQIKSAILLIDNLLHNPRKYGRQSLAERLRQEDPPLSNSDSSISRLLKFIYYEIGIRIKIDRHKFIYEIDYEDTDPNFTEKYYQYKNLYFRNILQKTTLQSGVASQYVSFGLTTRNLHIEFLPPFLSAILENRKIYIEYLPFYQNQPSTFVVCPLFLKEYLNRWYLITEKLGARHPVFALDRIQRYEILETTFSRTNEISSHIFKNTVGVNFSPQVEKVSLWVSRQQYPYFKKLPIHFSQKTEKETSDGFIISFQVSQNFELKQWILFFGCSVKVIEPKPLRSEIQTELRKNLKNYEK